MNTTDKYYWCIDHSGIGLKDSQGSIEICPQMVNPTNSTIEDDTTLNPKQEWWIEYCKLDSKGDKTPTHYWDLDCGGSTIDEAIDELYKLMLKNYGECLSCEG